MEMTRTVLSLALGLAFLNGQVQAAPPLTISNGKAAVSAVASNA